jgi:type IV secretory pathway VirJ component
MPAGCLLAKGRVQEDPGTGGARSTVTGTTPFTCHAQSARPLRYSRFLISCVAAQRMTGWRIGLSLLVAGALAAPAGCTLGAQHTAGSPPDLDLPVKWIEPEGATRRQAVLLLSGDGGFAALVTEVGEALARDGYGVLLLNSRAYLSGRKDPAQTALDVARMAHAVMERWHVERFAVVGYSRGAEMAPFAVNRFPPDLRSRVSGIAMFGLAPTANFEFHLLDLVKYTRRDSDLPVLPELERLRGLPMVCAYGREEQDSACRDAPVGLLRRESLDGGHHFGGDTQPLVALVLELLEERGARTPVAVDSARPQRTSFRQS